MIAVDEKFVLTRNESGISEADISIASGEGLQDIWTYQVPINQRFIFTRDSVFSAYLEDSVPAEAVAGALVDIVIKDASKQAVRSLLNLLRYAQVKEFQDVDKLCHLDIPIGEQIVAEEGEFIIVRGNLLTVTLDASDSYFSLSCVRSRRSIF